MTENQNKKKSSPPPSHKTHKRDAPKELAIALVTFSTTRDLEDDYSGNMLKDMFTKAGHKVVSHEVVKDIKEDIQAAVIRLAAQDGLDAIITSGGTGLTMDDSTVESVRPLFQKELTGFTPLFMQLSYEDVGPACMLSQATAGVINRKAIFCLPGSAKACSLAAEKILIPELPHMVRHLGFGPRR